MSNTITTAAKQIEAVGGLDAYLTQNPQFSLFSYSYHQIAPYAKNTAIISFNEVVDWGKTLTATVPYGGDLFNTVLLYFRLPPLTLPEGSNFIGYTNAIGYAMIDTVQIRIGEVVIDTHPGRYMEMKDYLETNVDKKEARYKSVGRYDTVNVLSQNSLGPQDIYVPLQFWFTKKLFSSIPMITLQGQPVKITVKLKPFLKCVTYDGIVPPVQIPLMDGNIIADFYLLSEAEKVDFRNTEQSYLIDQWQWQEQEINAGTTATRIPLEFTRCCKELVFAVVEMDSEENNDPFNYGRRDAAFRSGEFLEKIGLNFDGKERFNKLPESYYRLVTPQRYHSFAGNRNIYVIPFASNPEVNQPSGTVNFSRYDNVELLLDFIDAVPRCKVLILSVAFNRLVLSPDALQIEFLN
jgi:hypothetical protein